MTIRVAVIGAGAMGYNHARIYSDINGVELVGVVDTDEGTARKVAVRFGCKPYTDHLCMFLEQKPHAVTIAVPTIDHLIIALDAIKYGVHILIEKPIALTVKEGKEIINAARSANIRLMIGHIERFNPAVIALKERLQAGELGRVFQIDARRQGPFPSRIRDVGVVIDLAVHDLDIMRYISGTEVIRVFAETERRIHSTCEDLLSGLIRMSDGIVGTLTVNWLTPAKIRELYVTGEQGMFRVDYLTQDLYFFENATTQGADWETLKVLRGVSEGRMTRHIIAKKEPLRVEIEAFLDAVQGRAPIAVTGEDALTALALAQAIVTSGIENRTVLL